MRRKAVTRPQSGARRCYVFHMLVRGWGLLTLLLQEVRCATKCLALGAQHSRGRPPAKLGNNAQGILTTTQRERMKTTPLVVARLAQTASLGIGLRLDRRCFHLVRTCKIMLTGSSTAFLASDRI